MFPWVYEFQWSATHLIFLGAFFSVAIVIGVTVARAFWNTNRRLSRHSIEDLQWHVNFEELPSSARLCRHEVGQRSTGRLCHQEFDCNSCEKHRTFPPVKMSSEARPDQQERVYGLAFPLDRFYHRGHTWVQSQKDGTMLVGLDAFARCMAGVPDAVDMPAIGSHVEQNGTACSIVRKSARVRILSPVGGMVVAHGSAKEDWVLRIKPDANVRTEHLLRGDEVRPWMTREIERILPALSPTTVGMSLPDGGELLHDMPRQFPAANWDGVWGDVFLQG